MLVLLANIDDDKISELPYIYDENGQLLNHGSTSFDLVLKNLDDYTLNADTFKLLGFEKLPDETCANITDETFVKKYPAYKCQCLLEVNAQYKGCQCILTNGTSDIKLTVKTVKDIKIACEFFQKLYLNSNN